MHSISRCNSNRKSGGMARPAECQTLVDVAKARIAELRAALGAVELTARASPKAPQAAVMVRTPGPSCGRRPLQGRTMSAAAGLVAARTSQALPTDARSESCADGTCVSSGPEGRFGEIPAFRSKTDSDQMRVFPLTSLSIIFFPRRDPFPTVTASLLCPMQKEDHHGWAHRHLQKAG